MNAENRAASSSRTAGCSTGEAGSERGFDHFEYQSLLTERMCELLAQALQKQWQIPTDIFQVKARMNEIGTLSIVLVWSSTGQETGFLVEVGAGDLNWVANRVSSIPDQTVDLMLTENAQDSGINRSEYMEALLTSVDVQRSIDNIVAQLILIVIKARELKQTYSAHQAGLSIMPDSDGPGDSAGVGQIVQPGDESGSPGADEVEIASEDGAMTSEDQQS